jgi:phosphatidylserine/phosphatidylglycerophosphate/cardiolipin synthase-like enzyme
MAKPTVFEVHFFPNPSEEIHLINLISKTKTSLDIAMFTINNIKIASEIKNIFSRGIKLRILSDSECIKMPSSNVYSLADIGISVKIDDSVRYHMHHKFCVIDKSVVVTGSFNWTDQAVNHNQENLLFIENKELASKYSNEFEKLWNDFEIVVTKEKAEMKIKEDEEKKRAAESRKQREKEKKIAEKENIKKVFEEMSQKKSEMKTFSKKKRRRNRENDENIPDNCNSQNNRKNCVIF